MSSLNQRHEAFQSLHQKGCFVIPNPWDIGTAKIFAARGAKALATTSAGHAFTLGKPDMGCLTRDEALSHAQNLVEATQLPVSGDFENGFADSPEDVAETVKLAREVGLSGCSIEDTQMVAGHTAYDFDLAVERIKAAASMAKSFTHPFILCARADGVMNGTYDFDEALRRVKAFEAAGADLIYIPLLGDTDHLKTLLKSVQTPINVLAVGPLATHSVNELAQMGVRRISIGSAAARVIHKSICDISDAILKDGSFEALGNAALSDEIDLMLTKSQN